MQQTKTIAVLIHRPFAEDSVVAKTVADVQKALDSTGPKAIALPEDMRRDLHEVSQAVRLEVKKEVQISPLTADVCARAIAAIKAMIQEKPAEAVKTLNSSGYEDPTLASFFKFDQAYGKPSLQDWAHQHQGEIARIERRWRLDEHLHNEANRAHGFSVKGANGVGSFVYEFRGKYYFSFEINGRFTEPRESEISRQFYDAWLAEHGGK